MANVPLVEPGPGASVEEWRTYMGAFNAQLREENARALQEAERYQASYHALSRVVDRTLAANSAPQPQRPKKPELPEVDLHDVKNWLRRVEAAYARAGVTSPADKLSYLEGKREMCAPALNVYFHNEAPTEETWVEFKAYLVERYGKTIQQRARDTLGEGSGWRRNGRKPSDLIAYTLEQMADLTLEDLQKEMIFREMPPTVQEHLLLSFPSDSLHEMGAKADKWFEMDGQTKKEASRPHRGVSSISHCSLYSSGSSAVSEGPVGCGLYDARAQDAPYTPAFDPSDHAEGPVNAVGKNVSNVPRNPPQNKAGGQQHPRGRSRNRSRAGSRPAQARAPTPSSDWKYSYPTTRELGTPGPDGLYSGLCWYHARFGRDANRCNDSKCRDHGKTQGNANRGRR